MPRWGLGDWGGGAWTLDAETVFVGEQLDYEYLYDPVTVVDRDVGFSFGEWGYPLDSAVTADDGAMVV